ncbi:FAD-binding oxidoreductase [Microbacterium sp. P05]|uniref:FAD-binding oxidoreductase n=1 Tax=Microbacterium sp. P05 TaxID=3366948 RepID=UPI0037462171
MTPAQLQAGVAGTVVAPSDPEWDAARLFHSGIGEPALIVRAASVADVRAAVTYAAAEDLPVGVRGGGHSAWGSLTGGLLIDLSALSEVTIDDHRVSVGGGATWGAVAAVLTPAGLGISSGDTASVGVGGLTLGGGIGWMVRAWGLALDQLVGAQVVTATGDVVEASATEHPDLFWALRGGGGNFGVVTRFDFVAHDLPGIVFATVRVVDPEHALRELRDVMREAPRALSVTYMDVPAMDPNAPPGATVSACWAGTDLESARATLAPVLNSPAFVGAEIAAVSYPSILLDMPGYDPEQPAPDFVGGNTLLLDLTEEAIHALTAFRAARPASILFLRSVGGAYGDVAADATAFPFRSAQWFAMAGAFRIPGVLDADAEVAAEHDWAQIEALGTGSYGNFTTSVDRAWVHKMYPDAAWQRLLGVKHTWDPANRFSFNHNISG